MAEIKVKGEFATFTVVSKDEKTWFEKTRKKYMDEYRFENISDLQDLDRLLGLELLSYRYAGWLLSGTGLDQEGLQIDEKGVKEHKGKIDQEIRLLKKHMGMDRKGRIESEQQSVADFLRSVKSRAKEFGIHRDRQIAAAIDLFHDLKTKIGLMDRSDQEERDHLGVNPEQILAWIRDEAIPKYESIDEAFRKNQKLWIKEVS